jgi:hypothetical protein
VTEPKLREAAVSVVKQWRSMTESQRRRMHVDFQAKLSILERAVTERAPRSAKLTGPQRAALFFLRDETASGGVYARNLRACRRKLATLRALHRLGLVEGDRGDVFQEGTFVGITLRGREAIQGLPRPTRDYS